MPAGDATGAPDCGPIRSRDVLARPLSLPAARTGARAAAPGCIICRVS